MRGDEPDEEKADERATRRTVDKQRQSEHEEEHEAEKQICAREHDERSFSRSGAYEWLPSGREIAEVWQHGQSGQSGPQLGARARLQDLFCAARKLVHRQASPYVVLP